MGQSDAASKKSNQEPPVPPEEKKVPPPVKEGGDPSKTQVFPYSASPVQPPEKKPSPPQGAVAGETAQPVTPPPPPPQSPKKEDAMPAPPPMPQKLPEMETQIQANALKTAPPIPNWIWITAASLVVLLIILFIPKGNSKRPAKETSAPVPETETGRTEPSAPSVEESQPAPDPWQYFEIADELLWGQALIPAADAKTQISPEADAEMAAILDAFRLYGEFFLPVKQSPARRGVQRKTINGTLWGFRIDYSESVDSKENKTEEITVTTPSRGVIRVRNGGILSIKNSGLEGLRDELTQAGVETTVQPGSGEGEKTRVRLFQKTVSEIPANFLIANGWVGPLPIGTPVDRMMQIFPNDYIIVQKKMRIGEKFQILFKVHDHNQNPLLFAYEKDGRVNGASLISDRFRTVRDIGIGSTLGQVLLRYGKVQFAYLQGRDPMATVPDLDMQFYFDSSRINFPAREFSLDARIISILIGQIPVIEEQID